MVILFGFKVSETHYYNFITEQIYCLQLCLQITFSVYSCNCKKMLYVVIVCSC